MFVSVWANVQSSCLQTQRSRVRFPALLDFLNGVHSDLVSINEEVLERKVTAPV
jgi:hypothetical protein